MLKVIDKIKYFYKKLSFDISCSCKMRGLSKKYKMISLGKYCFPRVLLTANKLKPKRKQGEKSCPFDLAFFYNFDEIIKLLDTKFSNFYDGLVQDEENKWVNKDINAYFVHEFGLTKEQVIEKYNKRIKNLYDYFAEKSFHKFCVIASFEEVFDYQLENLKSTLEKYMDKNEFSIILINQFSEYNSYESENIYEINQNHNCEKFNYINKDGIWAIELEKRRMKEANDIYSEITEKLIEIVRSKLLNKK